MTLKRILRRLFSFLLYQLYARRKLSRTDHIGLLGLQFAVPPTVFHPGLYFSSKILGEYLSRRNLTGKNVLDMGCGSGILSIVAAKQGATVVSIDINPASVASTIQNARANSVNQAVTATIGDLFEDANVHQLFDMVVVNPPFFEGIPNSIEQYAWRSGPNHEFFRRFFHNVKPYLAAGSEILFVLSSDTDIEAILNISENEGFEVVRVLSKRRMFETLQVFKASHLP